MILSLIFFVIGRYLKNGLMESVQILHVIVTSFEGVPYFKVTLNSHVKKTYVQFTFFYPTALKGCRGIVFHPWCPDGQASQETVRCRKLILGRDIG